jgi:hypothetical protein
VTARRSFAGEPWPQDPTMPPALPSARQTEFPARRVLVMAVAWEAPAPRRGDGSSCGWCSETDPLGGYSVRTYAEVGAYHPQCFLDYIGVGSLPGDKDLAAEGGQGEPWPGGAR